MGNKIEIGDYLIDSKGNIYEIFNIFKPEDVERLEITYKIKSTMFKKIKNEKISLVLFCNETFHRFGYLKIDKNNKYYVEALDEEKYYVSKMAKSLYKSITQKVKIHLWGSNFKYFKEVEEAAYWIGKYLRKYGRINVLQTKEKFGTARVYITFGIYSFDELLYPGRQYPKYKFLGELGDKVFIFLFKYLNIFIIPYQQYIYKKAYEKAFLKFPLIRKEIIVGTDYPELVSNYWKPVSLCSKHSVDIRKASYLDSKNCVVCIEMIKNEKI